MIKAILFDLDGTLLNTLTDLTTSVNYALRKHGFAERATQEVRAFLGNGIRNLISKCVPEGTLSDDFETVFQTFKTHYVEHCLDVTAPYEGILPLLDELKARGLKMGMVSNKLDPAVQDLNARFFADYLSVALGESKTIRRKPHPDGVNEAMKRIGVLPKETLYVGDSEVDFQTARTAGMSCALVLWGFRDENDLRKLGAEIYLKTPEQLLAYLTN